MERQTDKINRQVVFLYAPIFDAEDSSGKNNNWHYNRAPEGYKFVLQKITMSVDRLLAYGIVGLYDGHEYTHWNIFPGVESKELLSYNQFALDIGLSYTEYLEGWECKEFTLGVRSSSIITTFKGVAIVWYYLRKMSWLEKLQYAVMQPRGQRYRKGSATTVERSERDG